VRGQGNCNCIIIRKTKMDKKNKNQLIKGLVISGPPGSGKTTLVNSMAISHSRKHVVHIENITSFKILPWELITGREPVRLIIVKEVNSVLPVITFYTGVTTMILGIGRPCPLIVFTSTSLHRSEITDGIMGETVDFIELKPLEVLS
jgi:energy-coupling factor transporter ATP-binding protein EcfA2